MKQQERSSKAFISESHRERETFRYDHRLDSSNYIYIKDGKLPPSPKLFTAPDSVLTGLAQLGTFQTGTARGYISLFDLTHQYIVAEASSSIRIAADLPSDDLALRGAAIPRSQGTCDHVLTLAQDASRASNETELPVSVVPNLADDARFACRQYCQFPYGGQFYAGVPIRTRKGINIGSYCVMSPTAPPGWDQHHEQRLRDISSAIMTHLEFRKFTRDNQRHERFTNGLAAFIEGRDVIPNAASTTTPNQHQNHNDAGHIVEQSDYNFPDVSKVTLSSTPTPTQMQSPISTTPSTTEPASTFSVNGHPFPGFPSMPSTPLALPSGTEPSQIFSTAAQVIQNTFAAAGCVFLDALPDYDDDKEPKQSYAASAQSPNSTLEGLSSTSSSDEYIGGTSQEEPWGGKCSILGAATAKSPHLNGFTRQQSHGTISPLPRKFVARLLKAYPNGKVFNFDSSAELQSSDSSKDGVCALTSDDETTGRDSTSNKPRRRRLHRQRESARIIQKAFPGARSVVLIPVWDPKRERWIAGGFMYSVNAAHFFSSYEDLSLLLAFSKIISAEILNKEILQTEKAKSDALGSLSHELRSPLHGIILSTEVLNDTDLTVYQGNATHIIETCCRTLLDTINHLLDFSKVNNVTNSVAFQTNTPMRIGNVRSRPSFLGKQYLHDLVRLDGLVEDVVVSVVAGFNFEHLSPEEFKPPSNARTSISNDSISSDVKSPDRRPKASEQGPESKEAIAVYVSADPTCDWLLDLQPGPLRRIVMNLVGNSLKHTNTGAIHVKLSQETSRRFATHKAVRLTVSDTGSGIGNDFLRHSLFQPFSQENALSPGIGMGLSLVKKMVTQLHGRIKVESQLGVGTTVQVTLPHSSPLQPTPEQATITSEQDALFDKQVKGLTGLRVAIRGFRDGWGSEGRGLVETICRRWLNLSLVTAEQPLPDVMLLSEDTLTESHDGLDSLQLRTPMIVVCRDATSTWRLYKAYDAVASRRVIEFVSQPIAPRVLAKAILHAFERWTGLPNLVIVPRPTLLKRAHSLGSKQLSPLSGSTQDSTPMHISPGSDQTGTAGLDEEPCQLPATEAGVLYSSQDSAGFVDTVPLEKTLLLVDDNGINLKVLSAIVSRLGYSYQTAENGQEAVNAFTESPLRFCGILMDISMPIMDGLEATRRIRQHERKHDLVARPVLALTGLSSDDTHKEALDSGVDVFLTKPVKFATLREALASVGLSGNQHSVPPS